MRNEDDEVRVWIVARALGALVLGIVLIPPRTLTATANLAFVFVSFTIVVAELGGRQELVTALVSASSSQRKHPYGADQDRQQLPLYYAAGLSSGPGAGLAISDA